MRVGRCPKPKAECDVRAVFEIFGHSFKVSKSPAGSRPGRLAAERLEQCGGHGNASIAP